MLFIAHNVIAISGVRDPSNLKINGGILLVEGEKTCSSHLKLFLKVSSDHNDDSQSSGLPLIITALLYLEVSFSLLFLCTFLSGANIFQYICTSY